MPMTPAETTFDQWLDLPDGEAPDLRLQLAGHRCTLTCSRTTYAALCEDAEQALMAGRPVGAPDVPASPPVPVSPLEHEALLELMLHAEVADEMARRGMGDTAWVCDEATGEWSVRLVGEGAKDRVRQGLLPSTLALKASSGGRIVSSGPTGSWEKVVAEDLAQLPPAKTLAQIWREQLVAVRQKRGPAAAAAGAAAAADGRGKGRRAA